MNMAQSLSPRNILTMKTLLVLLLGGGGALIGVAIYFYGTPSSPESEAFISSPAFITWMFVNEVLLALYPIVLLFLWPAFRQLGHLILRYFWGLLAISVLLLALFMLPTVLGQRIISGKPLPLEYASTKIFVLMTVGFFASALPLSIGICLIQIAISEKFKEMTLSEEDIQTYICYRDYLQRFLLALGVLLGIFILTGAALRKAFIATGAASVDTYPQIYLLLVGAYYTLLIALVYFPTYTTLVATGNNILEHYFALPAPDASSWNDVNTKRKAFEELLELKVTGEQRFLTNITILAPFVGSIFSLLADK